MPSYVQNLGLVKGETGATGPAGAAATIQVGTVTTGAAGSQATVTNVGTENAAILNFTIPQGQQGVPGTTPSTDNFVTTDTEQIITGQKTFNSYAGATKFETDADGAYLYLTGEGGLASATSATGETGPVLYASSGNSLFLSTYDGSRPKAAKSLGGLGLQNIEDIAYVSDLSDYVPKTRTINNKALSGNISLTASDVGALTQSTADTLYQAKGSYLTSVPQASTGSLGGIKLGYTTSGKNYAVSLDSNGAAYVNVPWTDTNTTYGVATSSTLGLVKGGTTSGKVYGVSIDGNGAMTVSVPWTDNNTVTNIGANNANYTSGNINFVGSGATSVSKSGSTVTISSTNTTYGVATTSSNGLMSAADKTKLNSVDIESYALRRSTVSTTNTTYDGGGDSAPWYVLQPNTAFADSQYQEIAGGNLNDYVYSGHFVIRTNTSSPVTNMPTNTQSTATNGVWHLIVLRYTSLWITQIAFDVRAGSSTSNGIQWRSCTNGNWNGWCVIPQKLTDTYNVTQTHSTANGNYPILLKNGTGTGTATTTTLFDANVYVNPSTGTLTASKVYGAVFNDYAEYRKCEAHIDPGYIVTEDGNDCIKLCTTKKNKGKLFVVTDTYGTCIGENTNSVPVALTGRVLVHYDHKRNIKIGDYVGCNDKGQARKMSKIEAFLHPERVVGTVSSIPDYDTWGTDNVKVENRIWINIE